MKFAAVIVVFALVASAYADVYMHNPRGGNNRVDDANNAPANRYACLCVCLFVCG